MSSANDGDSKKNCRVIPGMRSDIEPQPKEDPDFGTGMEYEEGDFNRDFSEADKIREEWNRIGPRIPNRVYFALGWVAS